MATSLSKTIIPLARKKNRHFNLSCDHVTSQDFFQYQPVYLKPLMPGESVTLNLSMFSRLSPLAKPTYGRMEVNNRVFVVPYRLLFNRWNEFITDTSDVSTIPQVPQVSNGTLFNFVNDSAEESTDSIVDYSYIDGSGRIHNRKHTRLSKLKLKTLNSLGYKINLGLNFAAVDDNNAAYIAKTRSLLPYLCWCKVFYDWYMNSNYRTGLGQFLSSVAISNNFLADSNWMGNTFALCQLVRLSPDFFTSAWDTPNSPTVSNTGISFEDSSVPSNYQHTRVSSINGTPVLDGVNPSGSTSASPFNVSLTIQHLLHSVTSYLKRHQIVGNRVIDRFFARFGIELEDTISMRSTYIGNHCVPLSISDVTSTSDTDGAALGEYAARGVARHESAGNFHYKAKEWCYILVISTVNARQSNPNGSDLETYRKNIFDFFTPEFDGVGPEAIMCLQNKENFTDYAKFTASNISPDSVFGFLPRYAAYKVANDNLTGDFVVRSLRTDLDSFHTMRQIGDDDTTLFRHSLTYTLAQQGVMDRIFNPSDSFYDHLFTVFHFDVKSSMPALSLFNTFDFELDDEGRPVEINTGGARLD